MGNNSYFLDFFLATKVRRIILNDKFCTINLINFINLIC